MRTSAKAAVARPGELMDSFPFIPPPGVRGRRNLCRIAERATTGKESPRPSLFPRVRFMAHVAGIVLCGGQSSRMGRPKAWLPFAGEIMLPRVVSLLGEAVAPIVVVAAPGQDVPPLPPAVEVVRDPERGRGPL